MYYISAASCHDTAALEEILAGADIYSRHSYCPAGKNLLPGAGRMFKIRWNRSESLFHALYTVSYQDTAAPLFAEYRLFYRALLQKRPIISRSLLIVATPYQGTAAPSFAPVSIFL